MNLAVVRKPYGNEDRAGGGDDGLWPRREARRRPGGLSGEDGEGPALSASAARAEWLLWADS